MLLNILKILSFQNYLLFLIAEIVLLEIFFNSLLFFSEKFKMKIRYKKRGYHYTSHPYLPYTLRPNKKTAEREPTNYSLQKKKYFFPSLKVNSLGFLNGKNGSREFKKEKNKKSFVIGCVGNSTTLNIGAGTGIDVTADAISVDVSDFMANGSDNRIVKCENGFIILAPRPLALA